LRKSNRLGRARICGSLALWALLTLTGVARAAPPTIELYTIGLGDDLFNKFGHAALCVVGPDYQGGGICYNYGTADFSRPIGLSWDVVRGRAEFWVSTADMVTMIYGFESQDRTIYRQVLPLDPDSAEALAKNLARDASPENRTYIYNHFLNNCSTKPRDLIDEATKGALSRDGAAAGTFRELALPGLASFSWALVPGTDWLMGRWVDHPIGTYEAMFLPRYLREVVEKRLGAVPSIVYERRAPLEPPDVEGARGEFWLIVVAFVLATGIAVVFGPPRVSAGARKLTALVLALPALLLLLAAIVSGLPELKVNELLLVTVPLDWVLFSSRDRLVFLYASIRLVALLGVALLVFAGVFIQPLWPFWVLAFGSLLCVALRTRGAP
jgi:hypothetical protein